MDRGYLYKDRLLPFSSFFQAPDQLLEVLDAVNIVMGSRADSVAALRDHSGAGHIGIDFFTGKVATDTRLCPLSDLDLDRRTSFEIIDVHAKPPRCNLYNDIFLVGIE